jgi:hypothetical protein
MTESGTPVQININSVSIEYSTLAKVRISPGRPLNSVAAVNHLFCHLCEKELFMTLPFLKA